MGTEGERTNFSTAPGVGDVKGIAVPWGAA